MELTEKQKQDSHRVYISVDYGNGLGPAGNTFLCLEHLGTRQDFRVPRWHAKTQCFVFDKLPTGRFSYRVWSSADCVVQGEIDLTQSETCLEVSLPRTPERTHFVIPIRDQLEAARHVIRDWMKEASETVDRYAAPPGSASEVLVALMEDPAVIAAITRPLVALGVLPTHMQFIEAHTQPGQGQTSNESRARFLIISWACARNSLLRSILAPAASDAQLWMTLLLTLATLDDPGFDEVFLWAARIHSPATAAFEQFARSWADRFNGLNTLRGHTPRNEPAKIDERTVAPEPPSIPDLALNRSLSITCASMLADIAHIVQAIRLNQ